MLGWAWQTRERERERACVHNISKVFIAREDTSRAPNLNHTHPVDDEGHRVVIHVALLLLLVVVVVVQHVHVHMAHHHAVAVAAAVAASLTLSLVLRLARAQPRPILTLAPAVVVTAVGWWRAWRAQTSTTHSAEELGVVDLSGEVLVVIAAIHALALRPCTSTTSTCAATTREPLHFRLVVIVVSILLTLLVLALFTLFALAGLLSLPAALLLAGESFLIRTRLLMISMMCVIDESKSKRKGCCDISCKY